MKTKNDKVPIHNLIRWIPDNEWYTFPLKGIASNLAEISFPKGSVGINLRVSQIGPFRITHVLEENQKYRLSYEEVKEIFLDLNNELKRKAFLAGSQSPLSLRAPTKMSDVDIYIPLSDKESQDLNKLRKLEQQFKKITSKYRYAYRLSLSSINISWLCLPYFYEAVDPLDKEDRLIWEKSRTARNEVAEKKLRTSIELLNDKSNPALIWIEKFLEPQKSKIKKVVLTPRWRSLFDSLIRFSRLNLKN